VAWKLASGRVGTGLSPPGFLGGVLGREPFEPLDREPFEPLDREPVEPLDREPVEPRGGKRLPLPNVGLEANFGFSILRS